MEVIPFEEFKKQEAARKELKVRNIYEKSYYAFYVKQLGKN